MNKQEELKLEMKRRGNSRARMLLAFQREGELNTHELLRFGPGLSSRLHELRQDGHKIVSIYEKPGFWRYVYLGKPEEDEAAVSKVD